MSLPDPSHAPAPPPVPPRSALLGLVLAASRLAGPFGAMILRRRLAQGKEDPARWTEKLGHITVPRPAGRVIWIHAVSVGEGLSLLPLLRALVGRGGETVLLTCTTVTAMGLLSERVPAGVILQYLPIDLPAPVARFLEHWRPDVAVLVESEFWPRLMVGVHARGIPLILANARISDRSARRWARFPSLARALLGRFTLMAAPDAAAAARLEALGADPARIRVTGTLKRAAEPLPVDGVELARLRAAFGDAPLWLAASTHAGEEAVVAAAHAGLRARLPAARLVLAPRHPARAGEVAAVLQAAGLSVARRGSGEAAGKADVYLADTLGEMGLWFELCPVTLLCGSLTAGIGGHNAYEPALHGSAILHGADTGNFADLYARLDAAGAARAVAGPEGIAAAVAGLVQDGAARAAMTEAARRVLAAETDGVAETAALIRAVAG
ncbi:3-deoxy-D-manno-octulosonic acid transferase [Rhodobacteraceae bacterium HSP-20]|uniref:3-deoxy-D-manno-octulosonic acid transferase n=1 Tax=Paragemmobacter amnigenus TaxID=2852097 RepID=A0ABS6IZ15_9RHOB|nr:glycosyltransferase N-terminal domain-containing protein [Rhodobacter amnigenus]MBU9696588.1 3-deoxy-D-manno-octulosonic acid transferase [Rhodobacter amnigenus]MBV4387815.1 3-deoxy-D-manno-octulosonic acid transferase [Rhodobacter amnigenus]